MKCENGMPLDEFRRQNGGSGQGKDPRKQLQGFQNRRAGGIFEELINAACQYYKSAGVAWIDKTPEPMAPIKRLDGGKFVAVYREKAQCDYKGVLSTGQAIAFEAKHSGGRRINQSVVTPKQAEYLDGMQRMKAECFIVLSLGPSTGLQSFYRIPWDIWTDAKNTFGHGYMTAEQLEFWRVPVRRGIVLFLDSIFPVEDKGQ